VRFDVAFSVLAGAGLVAVVVLLSSVFMRVPYSFILCQRL